MSAAGAGAGPPAGAFPWATFDPSVGFPVPPSAAAGGEGAVRSFAWASGGEADDASSSSISAVPMGTSSHVVPQHQFSAVPANLSIEELRSLALQRIESLILAIVTRLGREEDPCTLLGGGAHGARITTLVSLRAGGGGSATAAPRLSFQGASHLASTLRVLRTSYELLSKNKTVTQRELYYLHASYFVNQPESLAALTNVMTLLKLPRHALGILAAPRGWYAGPLRVQKRVIATSSSSSSSSSGAAPSFDVGPRSVPPACVYERMDVEFDIGDGGADAAEGEEEDAEAEAESGTSGRRRRRAPFILVVEKECIFRRLVEDRIWATTLRDCVAVVTGSGFPDLATRAFVRQLYDALLLRSAGARVYGLCDYNPFGCAIMLCFRDGSAKNPDANVFRVPLLWVGIRTRDLEDFELPAAALQPFTGADDRKAAALIEYLRRAGDEDYEEEMREMAAGRVKMEIEGLLSRGIGFLAHPYLPTKIARDDAI